MNNLLFLKNVSKIELFWCHIWSAIWSSFWILVAIYAIERNPGLISQNSWALTHPHVHPLFIMDLGAIITCAFFVIVPTTFGYLTANYAKKKNMNITFAYIIGFIIPVLGFLVYRLIKSPHIEESKKETKPN